MAESDLKNEKIEHTKKSNRRWLGLWALSQMAPACEEVLTSVPQGRVQGEVCDSVSSASMTGVLVIVTPSQGARIETTSDELGLYDVGPVPPGTVTIHGNEGIRGYKEEVSGAQTLVIKDAYCEPAPDAGIVPPPPEGTRMYLSKILL